MRRKIFLLGVALVVILFGLIFCNIADCSTISHREQYLNQLADINDVHIVSEIMIDNYIISGYVSSNRSYGIAIFEPMYRGKYKFQSNVNCSENEVLFSTVIINDVFWDLIWINKLDLDFARIVYYTDAGIKVYKLDASNNKILHVQSPAKNYDVLVNLVDNNGYCYG